MTATEDTGARRRGPRPGGADTRAMILAAAREEFAEKGFTAVTVRSIGSRAGVDAAMINHYFGSKAGLFREVTHIAVDPGLGLPEALAGPRDQLGARLARHVLRIWEDPTFRDAALALIRSSAADTSDQRLLREYLETQMLPSIAAAARGPAPKRQAALAMTHIFGVVMGRHVAGLPPLADPSVEELVGEISRAVQRYLDGTHRD